MAKVCTKCHTEKSLEDYYLKDGRPRYGHCKACHRLMTQVWRASRPGISAFYQARKRARDREGTSAERRRDRLSRRYGLTVETYDEMLAAQGGVCAICGQPPGEKRLAVDHDHETEEIRGLLCSFCNSGLGYFRDNPERLKAAARYLDGAVD